MLVLDKNGITEYLGNYDYYVEHIRTEQTEAKAEVAVKKENRRMIISCKSKDRVKNAKTDKT